MYHLCGFLSLGRTEERQLVESERGLWVGQEQPVLGMLHKKSVRRFAWTHERRGGVVPRSPNSLRSWDGRVHTSTPSTGDRGRRELCKVSLGPSWVG